MNPLAPLKRFFEVLKEIFGHFASDDAGMMAAALAFYAIFSIAPLVVIALAVAGFFLGSQAAQGQLYTSISEQLGPQVAEQVMDMVERVSRPDAGISATLIGGAVALVAASRLFAQLQTALNRVWNVRVKSSKGLKGTVWQVARKRLLSFVMVFTIGVFVLAFLVSSTAIAALDTTLAYWFEVPPVTWRVLQFFVNTGFFTLLFAAVYKVLPDVRLSWRWVWTGATVTALLFSLGLLLVGVYLGRAAPASEYGAAGSLVLLLFWTYYSAQIFFLGAEITQVLARRHGEGLSPDEHAVPLQTPRGAEAG